MCWTFRTIEVLDTVIQGLRSANDIQNTEIERLRLDHNNLRSDNVNPRSDNDKLRSDNDSLRTEIQSLLARATMVNQRAAEMWKYKKRPFLSREQLWSTNNKTFDHISTVDGSSSAPIEGQIPTISSASSSGQEYTSTPMCYSGQSSTQASRISFDISNSNDWHLLDDMPGRECKFVNQGETLRPAFRVDTKQIPRMICFMTQANGVKATVTKDSRCHYSRIANFHNWRLKQWNSQRLHLCIVIMTRLPWTCSTETVQ
jgi:FtsZ-binding cell division protein ZapB